MGADEGFVEQRTLDNRHVRRSDVVFLFERVHTLHHLGTLARERDEDDDILTQLSDRVRQLAHRKAVEQVAAREFIAREHAGHAHAQPVELREDLIRAVSHAIQHDRARFLL